MAIRIPPGNRTQGSLLVSPRRVKRIGVPFPCCRRLDIKLWGRRNMVVASTENQTRSVAAERRLGELEEKKEKKSIQGTRHCFWADWATRALDRRHRIFCVRRRRKRPGRKPGKRLEAAPTSCMHATHRQQSSERCRLGRWIAQCRNRPLFEEKEGAGTPGLADRAGWQRSDCTTAQLHPLIQKALTASLRTIGGASRPRWRRRAATRSGKVVSRLS